MNYGIPIGNSLVTFNSGWLRFRINAINTYYWTQGSRGMRGALWPSLDSRKTDSKIIQCHLSLSSITIKTTGTRQWEVMRSSSLSLRLQMAVFQVKSHTVPVQQQAWVNRAADATGEGLNLSLLKEVKRLKKFKSHQRSWFPGTWTHLYLHSWHTKQRCWQSWELLNSA